MPPGRQAWQGCEACAMEPALILFNTVNPNRAEGAVTKPDGRGAGQRPTVFGNRVPRLIMSGGGFTNKELFDRYIHEQDSAAFRDLVSRYGPAVRRVCCGVLADVHEAEDAFQATF